MKAKLNFMILAFVLCGLPTCGGSSSGTGGITISGRVLESDGAAAENIQVTSVNSGDTTITDAAGDFAVISDQAAEQQLQFEDMGFSATAQIADVPTAAKSISANFRLQRAENRVELENITVEESNSSSNSNSSSGSSSSSSSTDNSNSSSGSSSSSSSSSGGNSSSSSGNSSSDDHGSSSSSSSGAVDDGSSSSSGAGQGGENEDGERVEEEGFLQSLTSAAVRVNDVIFVPTSATEYRDANENTSSLASFAVGDRVKARGEYVAGELILLRLEIDDE